MGGVIILHKLESYGCAAPPTSIYIYGALREQWHCGDAERGIGKEVTEKS